MSHYTEFLNKTPEQLLHEAETEIEHGILPRRRKLKSHLIKFRNHLQGMELAPITIKGYLTGVKSFYSQFDIEIPKIPHTNRAAKPLECNTRIPTKADLQDILKICTPLEKAILLTGLSSGLSANEISNLTIEDFIAGYDKETGITTLQLRREKTQVDFITFLSPEASTAIFNYIEYRGRSDKRKDLKRLNQLEKQRVFSNNGYLFIKQNVPAEFLKSRNEQLRKLDTSIIIKIYRAISEKANKNTVKGNWNLVRSHNIRKHYNSILYNEGCQSWFIEYTMGHALPATQAAYLRTSPDKLKEIYKKYVPYLTIQKELNVSESPEYLEIKRENEILHAETARHVVERSELQDLKSEMALMQNLILKMSPEMVGSFSEKVKRESTNDF